MTDSEVLRRRIALLLTEIEQLPDLAVVLTMSAAERADALTKTWDLRHRCDYICDQLETKVSYETDRNLWKDVATAAEELLACLKRHDRCQVELLALTRRSVAYCAAKLRETEEIRVQHKRFSRDN